MGTPYSNEHRGRTILTQKPLAVVAVGGNSLIIDKEHQAIPDQYMAAYETALRVVPLVQKGWRVILTHGNGPQVGFVLRRSELARGEVPPVPMEYAGADIQGAVGYMFVQAFENVFRENGMSTKAAAVVTRVEVDTSDPAFQNPSKPIGSHMDEAKARELSEAEGWTVKEDAGRGWRRVVPSPKPLRIMDLKTISALSDQDMVVIACGGGGIPVYLGEDGGYRGTEAVIDKDLASSLLARELRSDKFVISTAVPKVAINFGRPNQEWLERLTLADARRLEGEGHFLEGSMGPKVRAVVEYVEDTAQVGVITDPKHLAEAIEGNDGTRVVAE